MKLHSLANGSEAVMDANIVIYAIHDLSGQCTDLVKRCAAGKLTLVMPLPVLSETCHRIMISEARAMGIPLKGGPARKLAGNPASVRRLQAHEKIFGLMQDWGVAFEAARAEDFEVAFKFQRDYGLLMNDALLAAVTQRLGLRAIASADKAFRPIKEFDIYFPDDLRPS